MSCGKNITLNLDLRTAAAVREALFQDTKIYTYDPTCTPPRVVELRTVIVNLDEQIEEALKAHETTDS